MPTVCLKSCFFLGTNLMLLRFAKRDLPALGSSMCNALLRVQLIFVNERSSQLTS